MKFITNLLQKIGLIRKVPQNNSQTHPENADKQKQEMALDKLKQLDKVLNKTSTNQDNTENKELSEEEQALKVKNPFTGQ